MAIIVLIFTLLILSSPHAQLHAIDASQKADANDQKNFIVEKKAPKKLASTSTLKEQLGQASRDTLYKTSATLRRIGKLQVATCNSQPKKSKLYSRKTVTRYAGLATDLLASFYDRVSTVIENLLNNEKIIKKAKRAELAQAVECMKNVDHQLAYCFTQTTTGKISDEYAKKEFEKIQQATASINSVDCLKEA